MSAPKRFPILHDHTERGGPESIPWAVAEIVRAEAQAEHGQSLETLASRGGLAWYELGHCFARHFAIEQGEPVRSAYKDFRVRA